jgi:hypothetical protein
MRVSLEDGMAWEVIIPIAASILQGMFASGMHARGAARENQRQSEIAQMRREELRPIIERLRKARDYFGAEEHLVRDFSRAADQMAAQSAQTGMTNAGSGGLDRNRADLLGAMIAELARFKDEDQLQREQLLAQLVGDPSLYADAGAPINVGAETFWGGLGGAFAGAGSALNAFLSTPEGLAALKGAFTRSSGAGTEASPSPFTVRAPGVTSSYQPTADLYTPTLGFRQPTSSVARPAAGGSGGAGAYYHLPF